MKYSLISFLIMMFFASMLIDNKNKKCNPYIDMQVWVKGRIIKISQTNEGFQTTNHNGISFWVEGKYYVYDSLVYILYK